MLLSTLEPIISTFKYLHLGCCFSLPSLHRAQLLPLSFALHICVLCIILNFSAPLFLSPLILKIKKRKKNLKAHSNGTNVNRFVLASYGSTGMGQTNN